MPWRIYAGALVLVKADYRNSVRLSPNSCILRRFQAPTQESFDAASHNSQIHEIRQTPESRRTHGNRERRCSRYPRCGEFRCRPARSFRAN
jgi:hypothetical protein